MNKKKLLFLLLGLTVVVVAIVVVVTRLYKPDKYKSKFSKERQVSIEDLVLNAKTFDLIGLRYKKNIQSVCIKFFTGSAWGHVSMIYRDEKTSKVYVLEIVRKHNVVLRPLREWLAYNFRKESSMAWVPLKIGFDIKPEQVKCLRKLISHYKDAKMKENTFSWHPTLANKNNEERELTKNNHPLINAELKSEKSFFCSEFVSHLLQECNVLTQENLDKYHYRIIGNPVETKQKIYIPKYYSPAYLMFEYTTLYDKPYYITQ